MITEATVNQLEDLPGFGARMMYLLERRKQKMLRAVKSWSPSWLTYAPSALDWSMLMIFDHLARTERAMRISCEAQLNQPAARPSMDEKLRAHFFFLAFRFPIRVRIPRTVDFVQPVAPSSLDELTCAWAEEREKLCAFLMREDSLSLEATAMRHPAVGALSLRDALRFLVVHLWHHEFQIRRLRRAIAKAYLQTRGPGGGSRHITSQD